MAELESERTDIQSVTTSALRGIQERMNALATQVRFLLPLLSLFFTRNFILCDEM